MSGFEIAPRTAQLLTSETLCAVSRGHRIGGIVAEVGVRSSADWPELHDALFADCNRHLCSSRPEQVSTFVKQVGLSDYYFGTKDLPEKMGIVQSLPAPGPLMMAKSGMKLVPHWMLNILRSRMLPLVGIVEDLPNPENRVSLDESGTIRLQHQFSDYDRSNAVQSMTRQMTKLLKNTGACPLRLQGLASIAGTRRSSVWNDSLRHFAEITLLPILSVVCLISRMFLWRMEVSCQLHWELVLP